MRRLRAPVYPEPRPILKWAGGKRSLLPFLVPLLPKDIGIYYEPFVGGGAVFFHMVYGSPHPSFPAVLGDSNAELVSLYTSVRDSVGEVIAHLKTHRYEREYYDEVRAQEPDDLSPPARAARTIFLNRCGFNGLYRVNRAGKFNVPFGRYTNPKICDEENLRSVSFHLCGVEIVHGDFASTVKDAGSGDFVYFDPPYVPISKTSNFTSYTAEGFGERDQRQLATIVHELTARGVFVMLSNADSPVVRELYKGFRITEIEAKRNINSKSDRRGPVGELVVRNYGEKSS